MPDLSVPDWSSKLASLLERASLAIGRLDTRISASPAHKGWQHRASWAGFSAARRAQGAEIDESDIFALDCGTYLPQRQLIAFAHEELTALRAWQADLAKPQAPHWRELIPVTLDLPPDWGDRPALLRALEPAFTIAPRRDGVALALRLLDLAPERDLYVRKRLPVWLNEVEGLLPEVRTGDRDLDDIGFGAVLEAVMASAGARGLRAATPATHRVLARAYLDRMPAGAGADLVRRALREALPAALPERRAGGRSEAVEDARAGGEALGIGRRPRSDEGR